MKPMQKVGGTPTSLASGYVGIPVGYSKGSLSLPQASGHWVTGRPHQLRPCWQACVTMLRCPDQHRSAEDQGLRTKAPSAARAPRLGPRHSRRKSRQRRDLAYNAGVASTVWFRPRRCTSEPLSRAQQRRKRRPHTRDALLLRNKPLRGAPRLQKAR